MSDVKPIDGFDQNGERGRPSDAWLEGVGLFLYGEAKVPIWQWKIATGARCT
jgi:hypothetical protein